MKTPVDGELQTLVRFLEAPLQKVLKYMNQEVVGKIFLCNLTPSISRIRGVAQNPESKDVRLAL